jgi:hypothetical protein
MKDISVLHDNDWLHISLHTCEAFTKMGWTLLPRPNHSPDLAFSYYLVFGPVTDALHGQHFVDDSELKQSFYDSL